MAYKDTNLGIELSQQGSLVLVYTTDEHHSNMDRNLLGVCDNIEDVDTMITTETYEDGVLLSDADRIDLYSNYQTQGYAGGGEFLLVRVKVNEIIE